MRRILDHLNNAEPAMMFMIIRMVLYIAVGATGSWLNPDIAEQILTALGAILGVDAATTAATRSRVTSPRSAEELVATVFVGQVGSYIESLVQELVPENRFTQGLRAVVPVMAQFVSETLDDDNRAVIQRQVHMRLRSAGILRKRSVGGNTSILLVLPLLILVVSACVPLQNIAGSVVDRSTGDTATLSVVPTGIQFDPGEEAAFRVGVDILGATLQTEDPRCEAQDEGELVALDCRLDIVESPTIIELVGTEVTATAQYQRAGEVRFYFTTLD